METKKCPKCKREIYKLTEKYCSSCRYGGHPGRGRKTMNSNSKHHCQSGLHKKRDELFVRKDMHPIMYLGDAILLCGDCFQRYQVNKNLSEEV